jgi:hypothetical protein
VSQSSLLTEAGALASRRIGAFLARGLDGLADDLAALQGASPSPDERKILARAIEQLPRTRTVLPNEYTQAFEAAFARKLAGAAPSEALSLDQLTLVDDAAIELEIALGRLVRKTVEEIDPAQVYGIEARVGELVCGRLLESAQNPLGVEVALEALKRACDAVPEEAPVRMALANALQPHVAAGLRHAYQEVNDLLASRGVQERLQYRVERARDVGVTGQAPAIPSGMAVSQALNLRDLLPVSTGSLVDIAAVVGAMLSGAPEKRRSGARILSNAKGMLYQAAVATPIDPGLLQALASLAPGAADGVGAVRSLAAGAAHPLDRLTGDLVANVFDVMREDAELPPTVRGEIDRLPPAAFKAAVIDRSFFANAEHPARRFLGSLSALAADPDTDAAEDGEFVRGVREAVQLIAAGEGADLTVYDAATERIERVAAEAAAQRRAEAERRAAELERAERHEAALAAARVALDARVKDQSPPAFIAEFLLGPWSGAIAAADADRRSGDDGADRRLALVDDLLWSIGPDAATDAKALMGMLPRLVRDLERGAAETAPEEARKAFLDQLMRLHAERLQQARRTNAPAPAPRPRARPDATLPYSAAMPALLPPVLSRGAVVEFREEGRTSRARLSWISPRGGTYLFTSADGPARTLARDAVARMVTAGELKPLEARPSAAERAIAAVAG